MLSYGVRGIVSKGNGICTHRMFSVYIFECSSADSGVDFASSFGSSWALLTTYDENQDNHIGNLIMFNNTSGMT
jgi:hypothetical protein